MVHLLSRAFARKEGEGVAGGAMRIELPDWGGRSGYEMDSSPLLLTIACDDGL